MAMAGEMGIFRGHAWGILVEEPDPLEPAVAVHGIADDPVDQFGNSNFCVLQKFRLNCMLPRIRVGLLSFAEKNQPAVDGRAACGADDYRSVALAIVAAGGEPASDADRS